MNPRRIIASGLALTALLSLSACNQTGPDGSASSQEVFAPAGIAVQVQQVTQDSISAENKVSGQVTTTGQTTVMVSVQAQCTAVYVEAGDTIQAGQAICKLDLASTISNFNAAQISYNSTMQSYESQSAIFEEQIALQEKQIALQEEQIALQEKNVQDLEQLMAIGAASQLEIDQAQLQLQSAQLQIQSAQAQLLSTQAQRDSTLSQLEAGMQSTMANLEQLTAALENVDSDGNVISPASGKILSLNAVENGFVAPTSPVAVIDGVDQLEITVAVSEALIPKLSRGDPVDVLVSSLDTVFVGTIRTIERTANPQTKLYTVTIGIPAGVSGLLAGMFTDVTFRTDTSDNAIIVPTQAILTSGNTQYVFVVEGDTAHYVEVTTGLTGNGVTEITSGLREGQQLVTVGQSYLSEGDAVRVVSGEG